MIQRKNQILIFCDGACSGNPGPGGWGGIVASLGSVQELGAGAGSTTNNRMELSGAIECLEFAAKQDGDVLLYTDSSYVINGITKWIFGWQRNGWKSSTGGEVANRDLWESFSGIVSKLKRSRAVEFSYVPGHSGIPANERCDEIAVAFSQGSYPDLYRGPLNGYGVDLTPPAKQAPPGPKKGTEKGTGTKPYYLSLIGNEVVTHATWAECERRVKGRSGAKFKKITSPQEEKSTLVSWGVTKNS